MRVVNDAEIPITFQMKVPKPSLFFPNRIIQIAEYTFWGHYSDAQKLWVSVTIQRQFWVISTSDILIGVKSNFDQNYSNHLKVTYAPSFWYFDCTFCRFWSLKILWQKLRTIKIDTFKMSQFHYWKHGKKALLGSLSSCSFSSVALHFASKRCWWVL